MVMQVQAYSSTDHAIHATIELAVERDTAIILGRLFSAYHADHIFTETLARTLAHALIIEQSDDVRRAVSDVVWLINLVAARAIAIDRLKTIDVSEEDVATEIPIGIRPERPKAAVFRMFGGGKP